jgi:hypothetical protein
MAEPLDRKIVVHTWFLRGIECFFFSFKIEEPFSLFRPFFNAMGFEMVCKAFLLAAKASQYEGLDRKQAIATIDELAKDWGHDVCKLTEDIQKIIGEEKIQALLKKNYDGFTGSQFLEVIKSAYFECRYPIPNPIHEQFPIEGKEGFYWEPLYSSGLHKFCYAFCRELLISLELYFNITIPKFLLDEKVTGEAGIRFCNLFFADRIADYISQ